MKIIITAIILVAVAVFLIVYYGHVDNNWTLMVCQSKYPGRIECNGILSEKTGFTSKNQCVVEGSSKLYPQGYACGNNCRDEGGKKICSEICNRLSCE